MEPRKVLIEKTKKIDTLRFKQMIDYYYSRTDMIAYLGTEPGNSTWSYLSNMSRCGPKTSKS